MADEQIVTNIVAKSDFSNLIADLNKVSSALVGLQEKLIASNKMLAAQVGVMNRSFADTLRSTGQFSTHFVSLSSDVDKFGNQLDKGQLKLNQFFKTYSNHIKTNGGLIRDLARQQVQMQNAVMQPLGRNAEGLMQYNVHIPRGLDVVKNKTAIAKQELMIMNKVIQEGAGQLINWGKNTQWAGRQLTVGLTLPLAAFGKASADAFRQADAELTRLTKVYGGIAATSAKELGQVRKDVSNTAQEIAKAYGLSFTDTIALAADIAATGKQGNELLGSIKETSRLAVLGEVDRQDAMKATLAIQTAFKQNTDELAESINFLNSVENQTSTTLNDLVEAIPKAGPIIKGLGGNVQDLALYLTAMREGGISASEGANALKSGLASLINPTKVAKEMFMGFGISLTDIVQKNAGNVTETLLGVQEALDRLDPLQKQRALEQLFGKFQFARMNALFENLGKQGSQTLQVMELMRASSEELANIAGRELTAVTESASGKYKRAVEGLKADLAGIGDQFLAINTTLITVVSKVIQFAKELPGPIKTAMGFLGMLTAVAGPLIMLTGVLGNFFGYIIKGVSHMRAFFKGGEGWKLLTPEILAADKAGNLIEQTFYSDAKAAAILKQAIAGLSAEFTRLEATANNAAVAVNPTVSTAAGTVVIPGRVTNPRHPLVGEQGTRAAAHHNPRSMMTEREKLNQTIHAFTPAPIPVNQKIGAVPQIFAEGDLPKIEGLTVSKGASTGIVAGEAAKWHALMGTLSMMTKKEVKDLKNEIARTGTFSAEINQTFGQLLPAMTKLTSNAAAQSAAIVAELQAGKITVDAARAKIIALNAQLEVAMGQATTQLASDLGRTVNLTQVPLINQPIVSKSGKSNIKEIFRKNRPSYSIVNRIANALGVKTWGGGYSTETTIPKRMNSGGYVYTANDGSIVPGPNVDADVVPAMLTPGEFVVNAKATRKNLPLLRAINGGDGSGGFSYNRGGKINAIRRRILRGFGVSSEFPTSPQRAHMAPDESSLLMWATRRVNQNTRSSTVDPSLFMTGTQIADDFDLLLSQGLHPMDLIQESGLKLGYNITGADKDFIYEDLISRLRDNYGNRLFGGPDNVPLEEVVDSILRPHLEQFRSTKSTMPNYYADVMDLQTIRGEQGSHSNRSTGFISRTGRAVPRGIKTVLSTASGGSKESRINFSLKNLSPRSLRVLGLNDGGMVLPFGFMSNAKISRLSNDNPNHGVLQIGKYRNPITIRNRRQGASIAYSGSYSPTTFEKGPKAGQTTWIPTRSSNVAAFLTGSLEQRGKYVTEEYMRGNYEVLSIPGATEAMRAFAKKATGKFHRGITLNGWSKVGGQMPPLPEWLLNEINLARKTGDFSKLVGKEFIMRRSSWSSNEETAKGFGDFLLEADVKNRKVTPASEMFPELDFYAPQTGKVKVNESESIFGGKFRITGADNKGLKLETVNGPIGGRRAMGGSVASGMPYLVGENGPEMFVPQNSGTIIPKYKMGGIVKGFNNGGQVPAMSTAMTAGFGLQMAGSLMGGQTGNIMMLGGLAAQLAPMVAGLVSGIGKAGKATINFKELFAKAAVSISGGIKMIGSALRFLFLNPLGLAITSVTALTALFFKLKKDATEAGKANRLAFGGDKDSFASVGINNYKSLTDRLKEVNDQMELNKAKAKSLFEQYTKGGPTGITLTIKELNEAISNASKNQKQYVEAFNNISSDRVVKYAADLKAQFLALGMSAKDASNQIYAIIKASEKSSQALAAVSSADFTGLQDQTKAITYLFNNLAKSTGKTFNAEEFAKGLDTLTNSILMYRDSLLSAVDKKTGANINDQASALQKTMEAVGKIKASNTQLDIKQLDALKKQNMAYNAILGNAETLESVTAKILMYSSGLSEIVDLSKMSAAAAVDMAKNYSAVQSGIKNIFEKSTSGKILAKSISEGQSAAKTLSNIVKQAEKQDKDYYKNKIALIDKAIKKIREEADARIKALQDQNNAEDTRLNIQKKQMEYQDKLAAGDMAGAAQAQIDLQILLKQKQTQDAINAIKDKADADEAKKNAEKENLQRKEDAFNKGLLASQTKSAEITANVSQLQSFQSRITQLMTMYAGTKDKTSKESISGQLAALLDEIRTSGNKEAVKFYQSLAAQYGLGDPRYSNVKSPLNIAQNYATAFSSDIKNSDNAVFKTAVDKFAEAVNEFSNPSGSKNNPFMVAQGTKISRFGANKDIGAAGSEWSGIGINSDREAVKDYAKQKGYKPGQYFQTSAGKGKRNLFYIEEDGNITRVKANFNIGGFVSGPGTATSDSIPAMLSNGEYVINAAAVKAIGTPTLDKINKMAMGGLVSYNVPRANSTPMGYNRGGMVQHYNVGGLVINTQPGQNEMEIARMAVNIMDARNQVSSISQGRNRLV